MSSPRVAGAEDDGSASHSHESSSSHASSGLSGLSGSQASGTSSDGFGLSSGGGSRALSGVLSSSLIAPADRLLRGPRDSEKTRLVKALVLALHLTMLLPSIGWALALFLLGAHVSAIGPAAYALIDIFSLSLFMHTRGSRALRHGHVLLCSLGLLPFFVHTVGGGFAATSTVLNWSFVPVPVVGVLVRRRKTQMSYLAMSLAFVVLGTIATESGLFETLLTPLWTREALPPAAITCFFVMNTVVPPAVYLIITLFYVSVNQHLNLATKTARRDAHRAHKAARTERDANEAKTRFLSVVSHELRNPLSLVSLNAELLEQTAMSEDQVEMVSGIAKASEMLLSLVSNVLDLSKIQAGKVDLEVASFNVRDAFEFVLQTLSAKAYSKGLELGLVADPTVETRVSGDQTRLRQILMNLVSNAIKFTATGHVLVTLSVLEESLGPESVSGVPHLESALASGVRLIKYICEVDDTGIGIPAEAKTRLFQEFSQADSSTTREYGGSGLGLYISKQLCELMGGVIMVHSEEGKGSTFSFSFVVEAVADPGASGDGGGGGDAGASSDVVRIAESEEQWTIAVASASEAVLRPLVQCCSHFFGKATVLRTVECTTVKRATEFLRAKQRKGATREVLLFDSAFARDASFAQALRTAPLTVTPIVVSQYPSATTREVYRTAGYAGIIYKPVAFLQTCSVLARSLGTINTANALRVSSNLSRESSIRSNASDRGGGGGGGGIGVASAGSRLSRAAGKGGGGGGSGVGEVGSCGTLTRGTEVPDVSDAPSPDDPDTPTILVVDDFDMIRDLLARVIIGFGFAVDTAADGKELVEKVKASVGRGRPYALVLSDSEMPRMGGNDACVLVRQWEADKNVARTPMVAMTANSMLEDRRRALAVGFDDFLSKPVSRDKLAEVFGKHVRGPGAASPLSGAPTRRTSSRRKRSKPGSTRRRSGSAGSGSHHNRVSSPPSANTSHQNLLKKRSGSSRGSRGNTPETSSPIASAV